VIIKYNNCVIGIVARVDRSSQQIVFIGIGNHIEFDIISFHQYCVSSENRVVDGFVGLLLFGQYDLSRIRRIPVVAFFPVG
jgi:hypothetical protein